MQVRIECTLYLDMEKDEKPEDAKDRAERVLNSVGLEALVFSTTVVDENGKTIREW